MSLPKKFVGSRSINLYIQTMGGVQVFYAAFFGWRAFPSLLETAEQMSQIAQEGFDFQGTTFKGVYLPPLSLKRQLELLAEGPILALLSLCCLIGGIGLLRLRSWARPWVVVYLLVISAFALESLATEIRGSRDFGSLLLLSMALILPYLPLALITLPPGRVCSTRG